ncbi:MAG TPA: SpoIIE family protein phosphatase [Thermoanaerobaculia bacterium]|jgi:sigma-B regulation protein RsbU (phosphoserine phosphatase)|nr:SpoIIE family protein phosphatase [Thermoanaerobaculia bacterium]
MAGTAPAGPVQPAWDELLALSREETGERQLLERLLDLWRREHGATAAGLYLEHAGTLEREAAVGDGLPQVVETGKMDGAGSLRLAGGRLLFSPPGALAPEAAGRAASDPLTLLLATSLKTCRLKQELKEQQFQVNYRVVELEALYDVGLAVASTLDLDRLSEEILLRAVSLLDARRGALYLLEDGRYRLDRIFGGEAADWLAADDPELQAFLAGAGGAPARLLPGARYLLGVPIEVESGRRGLLVVGDKESRRGVGPFLASDRRTLSLFANQAALALENARLHLQALEKERLEREMSLASEIQRQILPKGAPSVPGFDLVGWYRPARQVGGDYYDLFPVRGGRIGLVVGDVSGKGMPAALMVSTLHSALRLLFDHLEFGPVLLERLNRHIVESSASNKFITMLLAEMDPRTGVLHYMNAGHNPGILLRHDGSVDQLGAGGLPLGLMPAARFQSRALTLEPGDLLCIYTDGITEAESLAEEEFGMGRLIDLLRRERHRPLQELVETIPQLVGEHSQGLPQGDDQTLVLMRRDLTA